MKKHLLNSTWIVLSFTGLHAQFYNLTVHGGYGSGNYHVGDTVHVWSEAYDNTKTFSHWEGDTEYLEKPNEWHTTLIMPNKNISIASVIISIPVYTINYEKILGVNNLKNVYYHFPPNLKGIIYLFHGTSGNASNWINNLENRSFVNAAIADTFGIIVTEAEEITLNTDLNGDGKLRWLTFPIDTMNGIDYLNIKAITDTFIKRGYISYNTPKFSVGMSNGGSFSAAISYAYNYKAGVSYCASSAQAVFNLRNNPFAFRMAKFDDNEQVGTVGNYKAWQNDSILHTRNICHDYVLHDRQPIYPERFARITGISINTSQAIFNELKNNKQLDILNYALHSDTIKNNILTYPHLYPSIVSLSGTLQKEVLKQISASNAEHTFYSDYNFETLNFINNLCSSTVRIDNITYSASKSLHLYPNPTDDFIKIDLFEEFYSILVIDNVGQRVLYLDSVSGSIILDVKHLGSGIYIIQASNEKSIVVSKFVKQ